MFEKTKAELNKITEMDREKRWDYFKTYYLKISIVILTGIVLFAWFIADTVFQKKGANMGCAYAVELSEEQKKALTDGYLEYYDLSRKKYSAALATDNMFEGTDQQMDANSHEMALFAQIAAGEIYYLILDRDTLDLWANGGIYSRLEENFDSEELKELDDLAVDVKDYETGELYPTAIDLRKMGFLNENQEGYLVFTISRPDDEYPYRLLKYISTLR